MDGKLSAPWICSCVHSKKPITPTLLLWTSSSRARASGALRWLPHQAPRATAHAFAKMTLERASDLFEAAAFFLALPESYA